MLHQASRFPTVSTHSNLHVNTGVLRENLIEEGRLWNTAHFLLSLSLCRHKEVCVLILDIAAWQTPCVVIVLAVA